MLDITNTPINTQIPCPKPAPQWHKGCPLALRPVYR